MHRFLTIVAVLSTVVVGSASQARNAVPPPSLLTSTADLAAALEDPDLVLLHVTDRSTTYEDAHIPGARMLIYGDFAVNGADNVGSELPPPAQAKHVFEAVGVSSTSRVVIYGGSTVAAARAFFTLDAMGHPRVTLLDGGLRAWRAENRPTESGAGKPVSKGHFVPALNPARVATAQQIQQQLSAGSIALVDVRPDAEFLGTDGGMGMHAPGHIEGAAQLPWDTLVAPDGRFLPREQLLARLAAAHVVAGRPVVAYCMVGMRASVVYFVARHLGYDARLYDGSIVDWTQRKLPVKTGRQ